jgi:hypothetical protein
MKMTNELTVNEEFVNEVSRLLKAFPMQEALFFPGLRDRIEDPDPEMVNEFKKVLGNSIERYRGEMDSMSPGSLGAIMTIRERMQKLNTISDSANLMGSISEIFERLAYLAHAERIYKKYFTE